MDKVILIAVGCLLVSNQALAGAIYRCKTSQGVVFSQTPCAKDAVRIDRQSSQAGQASPASQPSQAGEGTSRDPPAQTANVVDISDVTVLGHGSTEEIIAHLGQPAARYANDGTEHWFYPNAVDDSEGKRTCAEMLIENGRMTQINYLPEDVMQRSVVSVRRFAGWRQPDRFSEKSFDIADTDVVGNSKVDVTRKLGSPDAKRVFNGRELWEYRKVRLASDAPQMVTIYLEFDGDTVASSMGN